MAKRTNPKRRIVEITARGRDKEDQVDGCDLDFRLTKPTPDHELPAAKGGVEVIKVSRRKKRKAVKRR